MPAKNVKKPEFLLSLVGRYRTRTQNNEPHVTVNVLTGSDSHFVYSGTLTMTEREWDEFSQVLKRGLKERLEIKEGFADPWTPISEAKEARRGRAA
ncbi:MAG TPA: hypothetical protein VHI54_05600 [Actinomycetota bacterium]|nr:hypothetical protein [Actinomycetota bacterium]